MLEFGIGFGLLPCEGFRCPLFVACVYHFFSSFGRIGVEGEYVTYVDKLAMNRSWSHGRAVKICSFFRIFSLFLDEIFPH